MGSQRADEIIARMRRDGIAQLRVIFLDYNGISRARSVTLESVPRAISQGVNFSSPTIDFNSRDLFPPDPAFDLASPDFWARADPATYAPIPYAQGVAQMYADLVDAQARPWPGCPRTALQRVIDEAEGRGLRFFVGFEPEGYLFGGADGDVLPPDIHFIGTPRFASLAGLHMQPKFIADLLKSLATVGLQVEQWSEEYGPGQIEVNLRYRDPLSAADGLTTFKEAFRAIARHHGLLGTFMPKPFEDQAGSGLHVHLSAAPMSDATNLFDDPSDPLCLSPLGRHALGGLLLHGEALTALGASTVNSYKRFLPGSWAPTHIVAAYASRAAFVRVPERETPRRLELRVGDPACNPYLFLAGIMTAMLDGMEREIEPSAVVSGDVGALSENEANAIGACPVPPTLDRSLQALSADTTMRAALGDLVVDEFVKVKRSEWDAFARHVGEWDRTWYLGRY